MGSLIYSSRPISAVHVKVILKGKKVKRWSICIAPRRENLTSKALRCGSHSLTANTPHLPLPVVRQGAPRLNEQLQHQLMKLTTQLIDPVRMKGWVGLVGWPTEQRHMCVNNLPRVVTWSGAAGTRTCDLSVASCKSSLTTTPPRHTRLSRLCIFKLLRITIHKRIGICRQHTTTRSDVATQSDLISTCSAGTRCGVPELRRHALPLIINRQLSRRDRMRCAAQSADGSDYGLESAAISSLSSSYISSKRK